MTASTVQRAKEFILEESENNKAAPVANTGKKATIDGKIALLLIFLMSFATNLMAPIATTMAMYRKLPMGVKTIYPIIEPKIEAITYR